MVDDTEVSGRRLAQKSMTEDGSLGRMERQPPRPEEGVRFAQKELIALITD